MNSESGVLPVALTIAGSDSGGGAGIQADLKTFQAFGVFGTTAVTAITVQNTLGVSAVHPVPLDIVRGQIAAVATDLRPSAFKTGMLATRPLVGVVAAAIREYDLPHYVLDPVMVATSGDRLLDEDAAGAVAAELVPLAALVTPNLDEAAILVGADVADVAAMGRAARALVEMGAGAALVKGGHLRADELVDVLFDGREVREYRRRRLDTRSTHGTGCTLSAAVAAGLALGRPLALAVEYGLEYVHRAIALAPALGRGNGPLNHLVPAPPRAPADS
ncbi:MAG TPA: bifunctional hydroxymethylpyrimidine kinase/phosphomethylpyrimidine kinase [Longimicrobiales bacterium]|nr:bifunctional hydroxymethylpyrimidine kinase/phosphomethylpyrimidine kinase [Longimicrobiales bacterium]